MSLPDLTSDESQSTDTTSRWLRGHWMWAWFFLWPVLWDTVTLPLFDAIGIVAQLGRRAYFVDGVRVANHHHGILSNGLPFRFYGISLIASLFAAAFLMLGIVIALQVIFRHFSRTR